MPAANEQLQGTAQFMAYELQQRVANPSSEPVDHAIVISMPVEQIVLATVIQLRGPTSDLPIELQRHWKLVVAVDDDFADVAGGCNQRVEDHVSQFSGQILDAMAQRHRSSSGHCALYEVGHLQLHVDCAA